MSKKTLISAITGALVVGAASTTFAAANPFSDVPADSWAYDAVSTLAADGVVDGYPDGTYKGQGTMTRYEMAQIVARAMAKTDVDKADKALVDKLAAEFAEELDNLGVRVADLEKKSDNVKWNGRLRYRYRDSDSDSTKKGMNEKYNHAIFRFEPKAYIGNSGWTANARIDYDLNLSTSSNATNATVNRAWVEGPLFGGKVQAGKVPLFAAQGMIIDDPFAGVTYSVGSDTFKATLAGGRYDDSTMNKENYNYPGDARDITADYYSGQLDYTPTDKFALNAGYIQLKDLDANTEFPSQGLTKGDDLGIGYAGLKYEFAKNLALVGEYAKSDADQYNEAYDAELQYGALNKNDVGSWNIYAGYRDLGANAVLQPTYNVGGNDIEGFVTGVNFIPADNVIATIEYLDGNLISTDEDYSRFFGQVDFLF